MLRRRRGLTKWASIAAAIVALLASPSVRAQLEAGAACKGLNVTIGAPQRTISARPDAQSPLWVSYADCNSDDVFSFPVTIANTNLPTQAATVEVWTSEGIDCRTAGSRNNVVGSTSTLCQQVYTAPASSVINNSPLLIPAATIANKVVGVTACNDSSTSTLPHLVTFYFLLIRQGVTTDTPVDTKDASCWIQTKVDLLGPNPPASVTAGVGDGAIIVGFDISNQESDTFGYYYYCDDGTPSLLPANTGDAGDAAAVDAATDASTSSSSGTADGGYPGAAACPASKLVPGEIPPATLPTCGSAQGPGGATSALLPNNVEYTIGVSAYDTIGNAGRMSDLACATPQPIDDFYKIYRQDGGQAGGGYCSIGGAGAGVTLFGTTALGVAAAFLARRRVRRRRSGRGRS